MEILQMEDYYKKSLNPPTMLVEYKLVQPLWKTAGSFLKKLKIELPYDPTIPLLGIYLDRSII